jgi:hypothetical protein
VPIASAKGDDVIHDPILSQCQLGFAGVVAGETFWACAYLKPWTPLCSSRATDRSTRSRDDGPMLGMRPSPELAGAHSRDDHHKSMSIDVIGVAVAFIALAALVVVLMRGER